MKRKIEAVIFDWAGTTVDFGCFAPVAAFEKAFNSCGLYPTLEEIRKPMGLPKKKHIEIMLQEKNLGEAFQKLKNRAANTEDIDEIYSQFEPALFETLEQYAQPLDGVLQTVDYIRKRNIKIGSTTGYTRKMMNVVVPISRQNGYEPDCLVCPDETENVGRPYPYMVWKNLQTMKIQNICNVLKIGDTAADIMEGKNAGCISMGVIKGSSMLGLSKQEYETLQSENPAELDKLIKQAEKSFYEAGADAVLTEITALPNWIEQWEGSIN